VSAGAAACAPTGAASTPPPAAAEAPPAPLPPRPWGFWATLGLSCVIAAVAFAFTTAGCGVLMAANHFVWHWPEAKVEALTFETIGFLLLPPTVALTLLFAWLRRKRYPLRQYMGLGVPAASVWVVWFGIEILKCVLQDGGTYLLGRDIVPQVMIDDYQKSVVLPLFLLSIILVWPVMEEFFFRGFLLEGFRHAFLRPTGAVLVTAGLWALLHTQYDSYGMLMIFIDGLVVGTSRLRTRSLWIPIMMHVTGNFIATAETVIKVHLLG
jgi:membrane protease YdiL (CAAX protease family)